MVFRDPRRAKGTGWSLDLLRGLRVLFDYTKKSWPWTGELRDIRVTYSSRHLPTLCGKTCASLRIDLPFLSLLANIQVTFFIPNTRRSDAELLMHLDLLRWKELDNCLRTWRYHFLVLGPWKDFLSLESITFPMSSNLLEYPRRTKWDKL